MPPNIHTERKQNLLNEVFWFNQYLIEQLPVAKNPQVVKAIVELGQDIHRSYAYAYDNDLYYQITRKALNHLQMTVIFTGLDYRSGMETTMSMNGYEGFSARIPLDYTKENPNLARRWR